MKSNSKKFIYFIFIIIFTALILISSTSSSPLLVFKSASADVTNKNSYNNNCGTIFNPPEKMSNPFRGLYKPIRTDLDGDNPAPDSAYFPVLIVFVQFKNDLDFDHWHTGQPPIYLDSMISPVKRINDDWWDAYDEKSESLSDYWMEVSRGKLHMVGKAYSVVLDSEAGYYGSLGYEGCEVAINAEIWNKLNARGDISWKEYDRWKDSVINYERQFFYRPDNYVDMIYKIHKNNAGVLLAKDGFSSLSYYSGHLNVEVDTINHININYGYSERGSGLTVTGLKIKTRNLMTSTHEFGHFMYANGHITYGKVVFGAGSEGFFSPYEMLLLGYMDTTIADLNFKNTFELKDYSSRDNPKGNILQIPIQGNESFILAHRGWVSNWDKMMFGDTVQIDPLNTETTYGKGLYIYHVKDGIYRPEGDLITQDLECADGFWKWKYGGQAHRYSNDAGSCYDAGYWDYYLRDEVSYKNDGNNYFSIPQDSLGDGLDFFRAVWAGIGKVQDDPCRFGVDRIYTNATDIYAKDEQWGDRWDAWNVGYNEIFSPYSSPGTNTWNTNPTNQYSGIFIRYRAFDEDTKIAVIDIYRVGYNGLTEDSILKMTPPSRPMELKIEYTECNNGKRFPKIYWHQNLEPDMIDSLFQPPLKLKRYKIFRAYADINNVPGNYEEIADIYIKPDEKPSFTDSGVYVHCKGNGNNYFVRYVIKAIDNTGFESVYSDFVSASFLNFQ